MDLHFTSVPSKEELRQAVADAGLHCYRFTSYSVNGLHYTVEAVDINETLKRTMIPTTRDTWTVPVTLTCRNCRTQYKGWQVVSKKDYDNRPYHFTTYYCPACPPIPTDLWLADQSIQLEKPQTVTVPSRPRQPELTLTDDYLNDFD